MKRRILITGGFGYVGGRVAQALAALPDTHVVLGSRYRKDAPLWLPAASVVATPWLEADSLRRACSGVDAVLHLAAMNEIDAARDPVGALEMNGVNSVRLLEAARAEGVACFVYLSTAHVYGAPLAGHIDENTLPRPRHPYASSHRAAEDAVLAASDDGKLTGVVLRLSNGFGVPAHPNVNRWTLLVNDLCRQAATNRCLLLRSSGLQRRDFVTLHDVGRAFSHVIDLPKELVGNGIFNVGGAWAPRIIDMTELIQERCSVVLGFTPEIVCPKPDISEVSLYLDYCIDKLFATGFTLSGDIKAEIDATLRLCWAAYGGAVR